MWWEAKLLYAQPATASQSQPQPDTASHSQTAVVLCECTTSNKGLLNYSLQHTTTCAVHQWHACLCRQSRIRSSGFLKCLGAPFPPPLWSSSWCFPGQPREFTTLLGYNSAYCSASWCLQGQHPQINTFLTAQQLIGVPHGVSQVSLVRLPLFLAVAYCSASWCL